MSVRDNDFGLTKSEYKSICDFCQTDGFELKDLLLMAAVQTNPDLAKDLYESIRQGLSYDKLSGRHYIPINRNDFYAYRKKCVALFKQKLEEV